MVDEDNAKMQNSYLILDERMRFLDCTEGGKKPSGSLLDVGVAAAMNKSGFDEEMFFKRGGEYKWSKDRSALEW
jgi:radical S-adenosyl methionine domain-containing protein 2